MDLGVAIIDRELEAEEADGLEGRVCGFIPHERAELFKQELLQARVAITGGGFFSSLFHGGSMCGEEKRIVYARCPSTASGYASSTGAREGGRAV
jgi:hypothetical protein